ncbi:MAG TPA: tetratricopeptide repeat protein, partial [Polyangiaceae bacterium]|nr:tetratricopeptide repeat protein [Polyangiaceae bacterium]
EAGLLWLELGDSAAADAALEASFERDPTRAVAFDKLFRRVRERKENNKLLSLITRRLEVTDEPAEIQKLFWEQARVLRENGDQDGALRALEHVTMLDPDHVGALALLGEINIRRSNFEEAAESLARLASLQVGPAKNRVTAGIAAVDLYEKKLDRTDKALEVLLVLHRAGLSNMAVRERLARAAARTGAWAEATSILAELMHERPEPQGRVEAARLAMAIHRDRLGKAQDAAPAAVKLLQESPIDGEALDLFLQTNHTPDVRDRILRAARAGLVEALQKQPTEAPFVRRLARVARALQDDALQQAALGVLVALGGADAQAEQSFAQLSSRKPRAPQIAISSGMLGALLAPGDAGPLADLFVLMGPTLATALGPNLTTCGVGRRDRVDPRSGLALRNEIATWAGAFGVQEFELYVGGKDPTTVQGVPGDPPALVVGPGVNAPLTPSLRGRIARELLGIVRGTAIARSRDDVTMAAILVASCKEAEVPIDHPPYAVLAEVERLVAKTISRKTRKLLADVCRVAAKADARSWSRRALASQDRVAVVASGDPNAVLAEILGAAPGKAGQAAAGNVRAEELLRFVLSPQYLELRRSLGLEGDL